MVPQPNFSSALAWFAGKVWENKVEEAAHNATAQLKSVGATAEEYLDAGVAQVRASQFGLGRLPACHGYNQPCCSTCMADP